MQFKKDSRVFASDGKEVGSMERVVIDPQTREVTHNVVKKGLLLPEDRVIPVDQVATATEARISLNLSSSGLKDLPLFEEAYYVPADDPTASAFSTDNAASVLWYPPAGVGWGGFMAVPAYGPVMPRAVATERNIPEDTIALKEGARVISADDKHVGNVERIFTHPDNGRLTHLVISRGMLLKERKLIPVTWVNNIQEDEVHLLVHSELLNRLPDYADTGQTGGAPASTVS